MERAVRELPKRVISAPASSPIDAPGKVRVRPEPPADHHQR